MNNKILLTMSKFKYYRLDPEIDCQKSELQEAPAPLTDNKS